jgi:hypothetical protein
MPGQQALFTIRRCLSKQTAQRILHRRLAGLDEALKASADFAAEHGLGSAWQHMVGLWLRLALAVRDADGHDLLPQEALDDLPRMGEAVSHILQRTNLLRPVHIGEGRLRRRVTNAATTLLSGLLFVDVLYPQPMPRLPELAKRGSPARPVQPMPPRRPTPA